MEESNKLPLKRVELSLSKFNEVAIPHHLDLLRQHKVNIIKYESQGEYGRVRSEQTNARRVAQQLRVLLEELDALRRRVRDDDLQRFDALTQRSRDTTLRAIVDYLGVIESSCRALVYSSALRRSERPPAGASGNVASGKSVGPVAAGSVTSDESVGPVASGSVTSGESVGPVAAGSVTSDESVGPVASGSVTSGKSVWPVAAGSVTSDESVGLVAAGLDDEYDDRLQLRVDRTELALREREAVLRGWSELQGEVRALHDAWQHVQAAALHHRDHVAAVDAAVLASAEHVHAARGHLSAAERLRAGAWVAGGAVAGALAGGPVGLAVGLKAGAAAALAGSLLGALGVRALGRRAPPAPPAPPAEQRQRAGGAGGDKEE